MREFNTILVSAFCQTPGIVSALKQLLPRADIHAVLPIRRGAEDPAAVARVMNNVDAWVNIDLGGEFINSLEIAQNHPRLINMRIPLIEFDVFHPDLRSVNAGGNFATTVKYTSMIGAWAYHKAITPAKAAHLFNPYTFANLGYLSRWRQSVARLKAGFEASDMREEFDAFYRRIKRFGLFMYTATHPKPHVIAELAKLIAVKLGCDASVRDLDLTVKDTLSDYVWPVYPDIAQNLSIPSNGYIWTIDEKTRIEGLEAFLAYSYEKFRAKGITAENIIIPGVNMEDLDKAVVSIG